MVLVIPLITVTVVGAGYFLTLSGKDALLKEKETYLLGVTRLLLIHLEQVGGYEGLEKRAANEQQGDAVFALERSARIERLNRQLEGYTEMVAKAFPGVGVGYYHRELNAILTYGPIPKMATK